MKFGKRLLQEAARAQELTFLDYRQLKHAIKADVAEQDPHGTRFERALCLELAKVASFYADKEQELAAAAARLSLTSSPQDVAALLADLRSLQKCVALNSVAVVKGTKKRNRHLRAACGDAAVEPLRAAAVLQAQAWFTSGALAALQTRAEVLAQELSPSRQPAEAVVQEYQCPICLDLLRSPVVLTCAHRFCWGCLLAHGMAAKSSSEDEAGKPPAKQQQQQQVATSSAASSEAMEQQQTLCQQADDEAHAVCFSLTCAVCRKPHSLNLDSLQVDPHLDAFLRKLERQHGSSTIRLLADGSSSARSSSQPVPIAAASAAAAAAGPDSMLLDLKPPFNTSSLAEASELAEAAAAQQRQQQGGDGIEAAVLQPASRPEVVVVEELAADAEVPLLPPQRPEHRGRLVVCLDLDGTLVTTFTPKRAPLLPPSAVSYIVGRGGKLNPGGVFVVERPGLGDFLRRIAAFSEVVLFTAGLEDYASPIVDAIVARYGSVFHHRLYRPATVASDVYPCIKDMARLGRDLQRCVLLDDTPLAFFRQPDHGIPILQFRGDIDDRMLTEAVVPLLESLHSCEDVSVPLARRFNMQKWFHAQGLTPPPSMSGMHRNASLPQLSMHAPASQLRATAAPGTACKLQEGSSSDILRHAPAAGTLLVCDFDRTLSDWDAGERLCDELAPELTSLLSSLQMPANFVPVTCTVLSEMSRRGVTRDRLLTCLREMGREIPIASVRLLQWAASRGMHTVILSDCNSTFINHILAGARSTPFVQQVITNQATFVRVPQSPADAPAAPAPSGGWGFFRSSSSSSSKAANGKAAAPSSHRLVVEPWHDEQACGSHGCSLCPSNLCKGRELTALRASKPKSRVIYAGDGANDLCPALRLGPQDAVLARAGHALERLIAERAAAAEGVARVAAQVHVWKDHADLLRLVQQLA